MHIYIEKLIKLSRSHNVNLYIVIQPFTDDFKSKLPDYNELFYGIEQLCNKYKIKLISFYNSKNYTDNDFYDSHHLNLDGAKKFTKELKDIINLS